jgi:predicted neuraminidase
MHLPTAAFAFSALSCLVATGSSRAADAPSSPVVRSEFIYETASFPQCHASTIAQSKSGLVAAWFGGTREGDADVGIWLSRHDGQKWSAPVEVANGVQNAELRYPCWNPVLFQPAEGPLLLFYKVGPNPREWWGMLTRSTDAGKSWSEPVRLPEGILGPVKNKPEMLPDGRLLCGSSTEHDGWRVHLETTTDLGLEKWSRTEPLNEGRTGGAIQPAILRHGGDKLQIVCRSRGTGKIVAFWSEDGGRTWGELAELELPNPNSGIDAVTLSDGRHVLVYNHTPRGRSPLNVAVSRDGVAWKSAAVLEDEPGEYSYPAVIQTADGLVHVTYTWRRQRIKHVVLDPNRL